MSERGRNVIKVTLTVELLLVPDRVGSVSQKLLVSCDCHMQQFQQFAENGAKNQKHPVSSSSAGKNALLMREIIGE